MLNCTTRVLYDFGEGLYGLPHSDSESYRESCHVHGPLFYHTIVYMYTFNMLLCSKEIVSCSDFANGVKHGHGVSLHFFQMNPRTKT